MQVLHIAFKDLKQFLRNSLTQNTKQAGFVFGGVLTVLGMAGGLFTSGFANLPKAFDTIPLFTPQGWAMKGWSILQRGGSLADVLGPAAVSAALGIVLFAAGTLIFRQRYA